MFTLRWGYLPFNEWLLLPFQRKIEDFTSRFIQIWLFAVLFIFIFLLVFNKEVSDKAIIIFTLLLSARFFITSRDTWIQRKFS